MALVCMGAALWLMQGLVVHLGQYQLVDRQWVVGTFVGFFVFTMRRFSPLKGEEMEKIDKPFGRALEKLLDQGIQAYAAETERVKKEWERRQKEKKD